MKDPIHPMHRDRDRGIHQLQARLHVALQQRDARQVDVGAERRGHHGHAGEEGDPAPLEFENHGWWNRRGSLVVQRASRVTRPSADDASLTVICC